MHRYRLPLQFRTQQRYSCLYQCRWSSSLAYEGFQSSRKQRTTNADNSGPLTPSPSTDTRQSSRDNAIRSGFFPTSQSTPDHLGTTVAQNQGTPVHDWHRSHPDLYDEIPSYVETQTFNRLSCLSLLSLLEDYLPRDPDADRFDFNKREYFLSLGWHLVQFLYPIRPERLLFDGTDTRFLPGPPHAWPYRLWLGGTISLNAPRMLSVGPHWFHMVESVEKVHVSNDAVDRAIVQVAKRFARASIGDHKDDPDRWALKMRDMKKPRVAKREANSDDTGSDLIETYDLLFSRHRPTFPNSMHPRVAMPSSEILYTHTLTPTKALLFGWSALTYNAHRIHLDSEFAQKEYGARGMLVQGTLMLVLALEYLRRILAYQVDKESGYCPIMRTASYKNLRPLYVDEPMTITVTPTETKSDKIAGKWRVQIMAGAEGAQYLAFSAKVTTELSPIPQKDDPSTVSNVQT